MTAKKLAVSLSSWRTWWRGVIGGAIGGAANAITVMLVKPDDFNFDAGLPALWKVTLFSALVGAALYLKTHPVPPAEEIDEPEQPPPGP